jgi:hypothetical protein
MSVVTQLYFQIVEEINCMFRSFSGWAIIRLRLEYRRKHIYYNVDIKNWGTRSRFTMFGEVCSYEFSFPHSWCPHCSICVFSDILVSTWWWPTQKRAETCSCFLQQFENTVVLRRTFIHLISTIMNSQGFPSTELWKLELDFFRLHRIAAS